MTKQTEQELKREVDELRSEVKKLKSQRGFMGAMTALVKGLSIALLVIIFASSINEAVLAGWLKRNILDTDTWVSKTTQLLEDPSVSADLSTAITGQLFEATNAEQVITDFVPERAAPLAGPLTTSLKSHTQTQVQKVISSDRFVNRWSELNRSAHSGIVSSLENNGQKPEGDYVIYIEDDKVVLSLRYIIENIAGDLSTAGLGFVDSLDTSKVTKTFTLAEIQNLPRALNAFDLINRLSRVLVVVALFAGAAALLLSKNKRRTILWLAGLSIVISLSALQTINFATNSIAGKLTTSLENASSQSALAVVDVFTSDLILYMRALVVIMAIVMITAILSGPSKFALWLRTGFARLTVRQNQSPTIKNLTDNANTYVGLIASGYALLVIFNPLKNLTAMLIILVLAMIASLWLLSLKTTLSSDKRK